MRTHLEGRHYEQRHCNTPMSGVGEGARRTPWCVDSLFIYCHDIFTFSSILPSPLRTGFWVVNKQLLLLVYSSAYLCTFLFHCPRPTPEPRPMEANKNLSPEPHRRMFWTPGSATSFLKTMKFLILTLIVFLILFQMQPGNQNQGKRKRARVGTCPRKVYYLSVHSDKVFRGAWNLLDFIRMYSQDRPEALYWERVSSQDP